MRSIFITGATGTLGSKLMEHHVNRGDSVTAFSRCDHKIKQFQKIYGDKVRWILSDIRNLDPMTPYYANVVYHCAASKHVDMGEEFPDQYLSVNYQGTLNVFNHIVSDRFVFFSTDKAVMPINFYGMSKALAERWILIRKRQLKNRKINIFRWGNIIGSQGSFIHTIIDQISSGKPVTLTHPDMTRFWLRIEDAVQFAMNDEHDPNADVLIHPNIKASTIVDFARAVAHVMGEKINPIFTGPRSGEKIHEHLKYSHDEIICSQSSKQYSFDELCGLVAPTVQQYLISR